MALDTIGGTDITFPDQRGLYYGGAWHEPLAALRAGIDLVPESVS